MKVRVNIRETHDIHCFGRLSYLVDVKDLTSGLLHLSHLVHEVPEAGLSHDFVRSEDLHAVSRRILVVGGWGLATDNLVESHLRRVERHT